MRLRRMKPFTPPHTSHTKDTRAHQKARRRRRKQGDSVTSTIWGMGLLTSQIRIMTMSSFPP